MDRLSVLLGLLQAPTLPEPALVIRQNLALLLLITSEANSIYLGSAIFKTLASLSFFFGGLGRAFSVTTQDVKTIWPLLQDLISGKLQDRYAFCIVLGLGLSVLGDVLLIPSREIYHRVPGPQVPQAAQQQPKGKAKKNKKSTASVPVAAQPQKAEGDTLSFKAGTFLFALAHIAYTFAFLSSSDYTTFRWPGFGIGVAFGLANSRWLGIWGASSTNARLNIPADMAPLVKAYVGIITTMVAVASATDNGWQKIVSAWMFMISDLFVAVDVFGKKSPSQTKGRGKEGWRFRAVGWLAYFWAQMLLAGCI